MGERVRLGDLEVGVPGGVTLFLLAACGNLSCFRARLSEILFSVLFFKSSTFLTSGEALLFSYTLFCFSESSTCLVTFLKATVSAAFALASSLRSYSALILSYHLSKSSKSSSLRWEAYMLLKFVTLSILDVLAEFFQECLIGEYSVDCVNVLPWDAQPVPSLLEAVSLFLLPDQVRDVPQHSDWPGCWCPRRRVCPGPC